MPRLSWFGMRRRRPRRADIERELRDHLALEAEAQEQEGADREGARRAARLQFGNPAIAAEAVRAVFVRRWSDEARQDLRYAVRTFVRSPVFTLTAVLSLALGIGANTAVFTLVYAALMRPLPVPRADNLALIVTPDTVSYPVYRSLTAATRTLSSVMAASPTNRVSADLGDGPIPATVKIVSGSYFEGLRVPAAVGRAFTSSEENEPLAVIDHAFWQRRLGGSLGVLGQPVRVNGTTVTIVGVAPPWFFGESTGEAPDVWATMALIPQKMREERGFTWLRLLGRTRPGATLPQVEAELHAVAPDVDLAVVSGARGTSNIQGRVRLPLLLTFGMAGLVLLVACVNLAGLLLTRGVARQREMAARLALGASRGRVVRQLMTESLFVAVAGAAAGVLLSIVAVRGLLVLVADAGEAIVLDARPDGAVLAFAAAAALATTLLFGLVPAIRTTRAAHRTSLLEHGSRVVGRRRGFTLVDAVLAAEVGLAVALVAFATMFVRTVRNLTTQDIGADTEQLVLAPVDVERGHRPDSDVVLRLLERVRALPGVRAASVAAFGTLANNGGIYGIEVDGFTPANADDQRARADYVGPGYLRTAGIPLTAGREFAESDREGAPRVAIVNETMARFYFGSRQAVGRQFRFNGHEYLIIGVARDAKYADLRESRPPRYVYFAQLQGMGPSPGTLEIRSAAASAVDVGTLRSIARDIDPKMNISTIMTMGERIRRQAGRERMLASLAVAFGGLSLLLASIGVYGTLAYRAAARTREIGVRLALGARKRAVVWLVLRHLLVVFGAGIAFGAALVIAGGGVVDTLLFGVAPGDPVTLGIAAAGIVAAGACAALLPALRAARLDPAAILRD